MHCGLCCRCGSLPLEQSRTALPRSRSPFQLWARPPPLPPSLSLFKTPHTQTRVFNMPWRTPQQQQQQTTKGSDSKTKTAVWESSNQGKLRLYNGSFCLCVQSPWMLGIAERTKKGELHRFLRNNADFTWKHVAAESGSLTHSSCRVCGAPCLPSCCSPVSSGSVPDRCTSSGSAHGTPPAATTERSALKSSVENEHGFFFVVVVLITALTPIITHCQTPSVMAHL